MYCYDEKLIHTYTTAHSDDKVGGKSEEEEGKKRKR